MNNKSAQNEHTVRILISELNSGLENGREFWDLDVTGDSGRLISSSRIYSPWTRESEEELIWYLETFASPHGSPFETARARKCSLALSQYGETLCSSLGLDEITPDHRFPIIVDIEASSFESTIFKLRWETLERSNLTKIFERVCVRRCYRPCGTVQSQQIKSHRINILLVTARPKEDDIDYLLVAQRLMAEAAEANVSQDTLSVNIEVVRPGTWEAVVECFTTRGENYFHIVHLDVHGLIIDEGPRQGVYLTFLDESGTTSRFKKANLVANTFKKYGVSGVALNACRSASSQAIGYLSLPALFIQAGIPMVVGMSANVAMGAVETFTTAFYKNFLRKKHAWYDAAAAAREALALHRIRDGRFGISVELDDWIVPNLYLSKDLTFVAGTGQDASAADIGAQSWSGRLFKTALASAEAFIGRLRSTSAQPGPQLPNLIGRDQAILDLENIFLLPFKSPSGQRFSRRHIHLHGPAGSGKTTLANYVGWWWKASHLVEDTVYFDCLKTAPWSTQAFVDHISGKIFGDSAQIINIDAIANRLVERRYLLIIDHLESLSTAERASAEELTKLTQMIGAAAQGRTFLLSISRVGREPWLIVPRGLICPYYIGGLSSTNAMKLAQNVIYQNATEQLDLSTQAAVEKLDVLLEEQEYLPAGIEVLAVGLVSQQLSLETADDLFRTCPPRQICLPPRSRIEQEAYMFMILVALNTARGDQDSRRLLHTILSLFVFRRRMPPKVELYWVYRDLNVGEKTSLLRLSEEQQLQIMMLGHDEMLERSWTQFFVQEARSMLSSALELLQQHHFIWKETLRLERYETTEYWHLHPLFSLCLRLLMSNQDFVLTASGEQALVPVYRNAFAHFYNIRLQDFNDSTHEEASANRQKMLFELDNISTASEAWLEGWQDQTFHSFMILRTAQSFSLNLLEKRDYRLVLDLFIRAADHYERACDCEGDKESTKPGKELTIVGLTNYLQAAGQLQNACFSTSDWSNVRRYNARVRAMLGRNMSTVSESPYAQINLDQANMVHAFEVKSRQAYKEAALLFERNLRETAPEPEALSLKIGCAKNRMMNTLGLLDCRSNQPDTAIRHLEILSERLREATEHYTGLYEGATIAQGWLKDNLMLLSSVEKTQKAVQICRKFQDLQDGESFDLREELLSALQLAEAPYEGKQGAWIALPQVLAARDSWSSLDNFLNNLLGALEQAYRATADTATLTELYSEAITVAIHNEDWSQALELHQRSQALGAAREGSTDIHVEVKAHYIFALCYQGLKDRVQCWKHVLLALQLAEETNADKIRFSCLNIRAWLELQDGDPLKAVSTLCEAGMLAYDDARDAQYENHGSILRYLVYFSLVGARYIDNRPGDTEQDSGECVEHEVPCSSLVQQSDTPIPTSPQSIPLSMFVDKVAHCLGFQRVFSRYLSVIVHAQRLVSDDGELDWAWAEEQLFRPVVDEAGLLGAVHPGELSTDDILLPQTSMIAVSPSASSSNSDHDATIISNTLEEEEDPQESPSPSAISLVLPMVLRTVGTVRDKHNRSLFWHLCGAGEKDFSSMPEEYVVILSNLNNLDVLTRLSLVTMMTEGGIDIEAFDSYGQTPLMHAIATGSFDIAAYLIEQGADINNRDFGDDTPLHHAAFTQDRQALQWCIKMGSEIDTKDLMGATALNLAVECADLHFCETLILHGASVLAKDNVGRTCILRAAEKRRWDVFALCLDTILPFGHEVVRQVLLDGGHTKQHFLHMLIAHPEDFLRDGIIELLQLVLHLPEDLTVGNRAGFSAYHFAALTSNRLLVKQLFVDQGADPNVRDQSIFGLTPPMLSVINADAMGVGSAIGNDPDADLELRSYHSGICVTQMLAMMPWSLESGPTTVYQNIGHLGWIMRHFQIWTDSIAGQYCNRISIEDARSLVVFKRILVFENGSATQIQSADVLQRALIEMGLDMAEAAFEKNPRKSSTGRLLSRNASLLERGMQMLQESDAVDRSDLYLEFRRDTPWRGNSNFVPQIYYFDRHGKCRYTEPLADKTDVAHRVWVVDEMGAARGILGATDDHTSLQIAQSKFRAPSAHEGSSNEEEDLNDENQSDDEEPYYGERARDEGLDEEYQSNADDSKEHEHGSDGEGEHPQDEEWSTDDDEPNDEI